MDRFLLLLYIIVCDQLTEICRQQPQKLGMSKFIIQRTELLKIKQKSWSILGFG